MQPTVKERVFEYSRCYCKEILNKTVEEAKEIRPDIEEWVDFDEHPEGAQVLTNWQKNRIVYEVDNDGKIWVAHQG